VSRAGWVALLAGIAAGMALFAALFILAGTAGG